MSKNSSDNKTKKTTTAIPNEVEELLKAAQDDVLLKVIINSHMAHSSSQRSTIDPDLDSRFQALKSKKSKSKLPKTSVPDAEKNNPKNDLDEEADDILARFSALKKSLPSYSEFGRASSDVLNNHQMQEKENLQDDNGDEEDEVEKVIKWARDAARLDPSPPSDIEDNDDDADGDTEEDSDEEVFGSKMSKRR